MPHKAAPLEDFRDEVGEDFYGSDRLLGRSEAAFGIIDGYDAQQLSFFVFHADKKIVVFVPVTFFFGIRFIA